IEGWDKLMQALNKLKEDITIGDFLLEHFNGDKYQRLRSSVTRFVSGYDTADPFKASAFALREEWGGEDEESQGRTSEGYGKMISYLVQEAEKRGLKLHLNTIVKEIHYTEGKVKAISDKGIVFSAEKVIIALPLGVLQGDNNTESSIVFQPGIPAYKKAFEQIGFGAIIKILLEFKDAFWKRDEITDLAGESLSKMGFILSDEEIPTWWTQYPDTSAILTGWLGGPPAEKKKHLSNNELLNRGLQSLVGIFNISENELKNNLVAWEVVNWTINPFTLGSYVYDTVDSHKAREVLTKPIENTLYFAGEFTYEGQAMGTVEAALTSGLDVAKKIL
ncbi:MAG: flavin monoamine oxidase family protein, partial [Mucilaginibacter sp.]